MAQNDIVCNGVTFKLEIFSEKTYTDILEKTTFLILY